VSAHFCKTYHVCLFISSRREFCEVDDTIIGMRQWHALAKDKEKIQANVKSWVVLLEQDAEELARDEETDF